MIFIFNQSRRKTTECLWASAPRKKKRRPKKKNLNNNSVPGKDIRRFLFFTKRRIDFPGEKINARRRLPLVRIFCPRLTARGRPPQPPLFETTAGLPLDGSLWTENSDTPCTRRQPSTG